MIMERRRMKPGQVTEISVLATRVYNAMRFLHEDRHYKLEEIRIVTGGGSLVDEDGQKITILDDAHMKKLTHSGQLGRERDRLHKNSVLKIRDLRFTLAVRKFINGRSGKMHWVEAKNAREVGQDGKRASMQWLWSPQLDTFEQLERLVVEARKLGFERFEQMERADNGLPVPAFLRRRAPKRNGHAARARD
jgi:hypothetical protein